MPSDPQPVTEAGSKDVPPEVMHRLHPMTLAYRVVVSLPALVIILLPVLRAPDANAWLSITMLLLYGVLVMPLIILQYLRFRYAVTPREIIIHKGVFTYQHRNIPMERVQNIEIEQSLLPRMLGMAKVKVDTAGSSTTEGVIEYVSLDEAKRLQSTVQHFQKAQAQRAETEQPAVEPGGPVEQSLFAMSIGRVMLSGVFRFSLLYIVVIFSATEYLGVNPEDIARWLSGNRLEEFTLVLEASPGLVIAATLIMVCILAWITGILTNLNRFYGFRLTREGDKLHLRHGLLTVTEGTIPLKKVQALKIRTNLLMAAFGWHTLELQTVGFDQGDRGYRVAAPFAEREEIHRLARSIGFEEPPANFQFVSRLMIRRTFIRYAGGLILAVGLTSIFWTGAVWVLIAVPFLYFLAILQYRHHGFREDGAYLYVRRGVLRRNLWIIPVERFQVFYISQTIFQRRLRLSSVYVDTPGAGMVSPPIVMDLPTDTATQIVALLYEQFTVHFSGGTVARISTE